MEKREIEYLFEKIEGCRFYSFEQIKKWFRDELKAELPNLSITACDGINQEIAERKTEVDYAADATLGAKFLGMDYADFTIDYILDNAGRMYVTYARWN